MQQIVKISTLYVILISITVIGIKNHVTLLPPILEEGGRDGWLSVLVGFIYIVPILAGVFVAQRENFVIRNKAIKIMLALLLFLLCTMTLVEMLQWINATFLPTTPIVVLLAGYLALCVFLASILPCKVLLEGELRY